MRISDLLSVCLRNLTRRRVRTALTVIGVVIGVCAIILMVSLGIGARESMMQMLAEWGDLTIIQVYNYGGGETKLDDKALAQIQAMDNVQIATPFYNSRVSFRLKSRNGRTSEDILLHLKLTKNGGIPCNHWPEKPSPPAASLSCSPA